MAGAEVLAILPLVISGIENYRKVARPFKRYKHFESEVRTFQAVFRTQNTFYRLSVRRMLELAVDAETVEAMLCNGEHAMWYSPLLDVDLRAKLGLTYEACAGNIEEMIVQLASIRQVDKKLSKILAEDPKRPKTAIQQWQERISAKLRTCLSEHSLDDLLGSLKERNQDLRDLLAESERVATAFPRELTRSASVAVSMDERRRWKLIQRNADGLHESLAMPCPAHAEHVASLGLCPVLAASSEGRITFELAFRQPVTTMTQVADPMWLEIHSEVNDNDDQSSGSTLAGVGMSTSRTVASPDRQIQSMNIGSNKPKKSAMKRPNEEANTSLAKRLHSQVHFDGRSIVFPLRVMRASLDQENLCMGNDFCTKLSECWQRHSSQTEYVGLLTASTGTKQLVYITKQCRQRRDQSPTTLANFFTILRGMPKIRKLLHLERVRFARMLATSVLYFHSTPWLRDGWWRSDNICIRGQAEAVELTDPFIELPISNIRRDVSTATEDLPYHNPLFFGLALVLIELAYKKPFRTLLQPWDTRGGQRTAREAEFYAARRCCSTIASKMGPAYKKVVERLLREQDPDLLAPRSQEAFYLGIVCELRRIEKVMAEM